MQNLINAIEADIFKRDKKKTSNVVEGNTKKKKRKEATKIL